MHGDGHFDAAVAARYDDDVADLATAEVLDPTVDLLADLAGGGAALEFAIGTGRVALPLAARGVHVEGIELSQAMVGELRAKPRGTELPVTIGDMADTRLERSFRLVYLVFNTIENLTSQAEQVACFRNAAAHLDPGGCFVVEVGVPDLQRLPRGQVLVPFEYGPDRVGFDEYDVATQSMTSHHIGRKDGELGWWSIPMRYVWPAELDLMAQLAGMTLAHRWEDWTRTPFDGDSQQHISVWRTPRRVPS